MTEREGQILDIARLDHRVGDELEIDDNAVISEGDDNGCFVQAWMWVSFHDTSLDKESPAARLEYLRGEILAERISYGELAELQDLAAHIQPDDVLLLQWAGVPEFPED